MGQHPTRPTHAKQLTAWILSNGIGNVSLYWCWRIPMHSFMLYLDWTYLVHSHIGKFKNVAGHNASHNAQSQVTI